MRITRRLTSLLAALALMIAAGGAATASRVTATAGPQVFAEPDSHLAPILSLIRTARRSIALEVYLLTNRTIISELEKAQRRGVDVRVMLEQRPYGSGRYAQLGYSELRSGGVNVRWADESAFTYTHEKAMVVDDSVAGIFTFNLTSSGLYSNREFGVIDHNTADAGALQRIFDGDWNRRPIRGGTGRLVVSPINARPDLETMIGRARHTLDIYAEEIDDPAIESDLARAEARRVRVRLITSADSPGVETLRRAGVSVDIMTSPYVHAKAIVSDGGATFIGSENISTTSLDRNREVGIMLGAGAAQVIERTFNADWAGRHPGRGSAPIPPPAPSASGLSVRVSVSPPVVTRGRYLTIAAGTTPGASCTIRVTYPDGYVSRAATLGTVRTAGPNGSVAWSWRVGSTVTGTAHAAVTCRLGNREATGTASFVIQ